MKYLNDEYNNACKPKYQKYKKNGEIILIDNFFENFESAKNFFITKDKWKCISYQDNTRPGYESLLPNWVGKSLLEKAIVDNNLCDKNYKSCNFQTNCNFLYFSNENLSGLTNCDLFPHVDSYKNNDYAEYVCLVNLNEVPILTNFFTFNGHKSCTQNLFGDFKEYETELEREIVNLYHSKSITRKEVKDFLQKKQKLKIELINRIEYLPNQAILYPLYLFHSANVSKHFTEKNPRCSLRIQYYTSLKKINYY